jgi:hypothetical protein
MYSNRLLILTKYFLVVGLLFFYSTQIVRAECGFWYGITQQCLRENSYDDEISGGVMCTNNPARCCSPAELCEPTEPTRPPDTCIPLSNTSNRNTGYIDARDPVYCQAQCLDDFDFSIYPYVACDIGNTCARAGLCPTPPPVGANDECSQQPLICNQRCAEGGRCVVQTGGGFACVCDDESEIPPYNFCANIPDAEQSTCTDCLNNEGVWTALGCIYVEQSTFASFIFLFALGGGGGIAFLIMLYGLFLIVTAAGDPEKMTAGKQAITAALIGLLFIIFSVIILNLIGVQILGIPGF